MLIQQVPSIKLLVSSRRDRWKESSGQSRRKVWKSERGGGGGNRQYVIYNRFCIKLDQNIWWFVVILHGLLMEQGLLLICSKSPSALNPAPGLHRPWSWCTFWSSLISISCSNGFDHDCQFAKSKTQNIFFILRRRCHRPEKIRTEKTRQKKEGGDDSTASTFLEQVRKFYLYF